MSTTAQNAVVVDQLALPAVLMKVNGILIMAGAGLMTLLFTVAGLLLVQLAGFNAMFLGAILAAANIILGHYVYSAGSAMTGRYTFRHCKIASVLSLVLGPLGLFAGVLGLSALARPDVRASFNS